MKNQNQVNSAKKESSKHRRSNKKQGRISVVILILIGAAGVVFLSIFSVVYAARHLVPPKDTEVGIVAVVATVTLLAVLGQIGATVLQWDAMRDQHKVMSDTLEATRKAFELTDRPWLAVDVAFSSPLTFNDDGGGQFALEITARNVGRSVAVNVTANAGTVVPRMGDPWANIIAEQTKVCQNINSEFYAVFPEQSHPVVINFLLSPQGLERGRMEEANFIQLYLVGCVDYQFSGYEAHHQTRFIYQVFRSTTEHPKKPKLILLGGDVPMKRIILENRSTTAD